MITVDLTGKGVLVTGGTRGLGKAIGMEFSRAGGTVFLTHRWGSVAEEEIIAQFRERGLPAPHVIESDASDPDATRTLMAGIREITGALHVVVSNVAFAKVVRDLPDLKRSSLDLSIGYSAWPVVDLVQASREVLGSLPRYVLGISSDGGEVCHEGYDLAGAAKSVMETLCRYLAHRLRTDGVCVNVVRPGFLDTVSSRATVGDAAVEAIRERLGSHLLQPDSVARACVALCSGLMDSVTGQVIVVDEGWALTSPLALLTGREAPAGFPEESR